MIGIIPNSFGTRLLERDGSFSYASTQVDLPPHLAKHHQQMAAQIPDAHLADHGRETDPHVTVKYGLDPKHLSRAAAVVRQHPPIPVRFGKTSAFTGGDDGDVVKVDVHSKALHALHHAIKQAVPNTETYPTYRPHVTVAYVKPGKAAPYAGDNPLTGQTHTFTHVTLSDTQGQKRRVRLQGSALHEVNHCHGKGSKGHPCGGNAPKLSQVDREVLAHVKKRGVPYMPVLSNSWSKSLSKLEKLGLVRFNKKTWRYEAP